MSPALLAALLLASTPIATPTEGSRLQTPGSRLEATPPGLEPGARSPEPASSQPAPRLLDLSTGPSLGGAVAAVVLLSALAAAALVAARRRGRPGARIVEVIETTHLGPKRALVVARVQGELLLLGSSEAGIALLQSRPGVAVAQVAEPASLRSGPPPAQASALAGLLAKLRRPRAPHADAPAFDALLHESAEDQELRRKLAHGLAGSVR